MFARKMLWALVAGTALCFSTGCGGTELPEEVLNADVSQAQPDIQRIGPDALAGASAEKPLLVDLTDTGKAYVIEYTDVSELAHVTVKQEAGSYNLREKLLADSASSSPGLKRVILSGDRGVANAAAKKLAEDPKAGQRAGSVSQSSTAEESLIIVCDECHSHGDIIHCTGCVAY
jgi:hypothetical protein